MILDSYTCDPWQPQELVPVVLMRGLVASACWLCLAWCWCCSGSLRGTPVCPLVCLLKCHQQTNQWFVATQQCTQQCCGADGMLCVPCGRISLLKPVLMNGFAHQQSSHPGQGSFSRHAAHDTSVQHAEVAELMQLGGCFVGPK
jgi:hypothetical protein